MTAKARGRPRGSSPNRDIDDPVLRRAALWIAGGLVQGPTEAFRKATKEEDGPIIRRLQRRWHRDGANLLENARRHLSEQRWDHDAKALELSSPDLFAQLKAFAESEAGTAILAGMAADDRPGPFMSLGILKLWELLQENSPAGIGAAEKAFATSYAGWCRYSIEPDAVFLRRFAELCLTKAAEQDQAAPGSAEGAAK